jgi:hypothetical protein
LPLFSSAGGKADLTTLRIYPRDLGKAEAEVIAQAYSKNGFSFYN